MPHPRLLSSSVAGATTLLVASTAFAGDAPPAADTGDTAWILVSSALVLFMTLPGLFLFYGGLLQKRNVLSVMVHCFALAAAVTILWLAFGYSVAFDSTDMVKDAVGLNAFVGGMGKAFLSGLDGSSLTGTIPEVLFFLFQLTFAIITPALFVGAFAERMKFSAVMLFSLLWVVVVYLPICHMVWGGDGAFFADRGVKDFAGGIVVHITAGFAALVAAIVVGPRLGYPERPFIPHNLTMTMTGTGMLWVGWFGFNGGSALGANGDAALAIVATQVSASAAAIMWSAIEWVKQGKPSALGMATGAIAGLAAVTPAAGFIGPVGGLCIGLASGAVCYLASTSIKQRFGYDDSLDVFGVHGVGGLVGTLLLGVFADPSLGGRGDLSMGAQLGAQALGAIVTIVYTVLASYVLLVIVRALIGLRVTEQEEREGLDATDHAETGYEI